MEMPTQMCLPVKSCKAVKCCCGKVCKGTCGLKMHQRSCRVIDDLEDELQQQMTEALNVNDENHEDNTDPVKVTLYDETLILSKKIFIYIHIK
jgi:hypothetical protein